MYVCLNASLINKTFECIIDTITEDGEYYVCRTYMDVPDIDGLVFVKNEKEHSVGEFIKAKVEQTLEYDLVAIEI